MIKSEILRDIQQIAAASELLAAIADAQRTAAPSVVINHALPTVAIELANGSTFFFQGEEASDLLREAEETGVDVEDVILWLAQRW